ncbi:helix-turn-helix domain-containing protein [Pararhodobacter zhoushanensis]|uniref:helix-turn-helix domain-containing protein n=1 Tax=Pararhodobacter zhoushanensis TaxID=2479545 RepID=UPI000F8E8AC8|nr:helix-turn-helix transcriptional regulator [Pararhodobacter zhoushanensis]
MTKRFYDALKDALTVAGWSIPQLCEKAGVSKDQVTKFMQRSAKGVKASTNVDDAVKLAHALGFTLDEMLQDDSAALRSDIASLWRSLDEGERDLLRAAARGRRE